MGLILLLDEAVRDRMRKCVETLVQQFMHSVRPIYGSTMYGRPYHIGSCVLIEIDSNRYLVTAAHVIDHNQETTLYLAGENCLVQIESKALVTNPDSGKRNDDKLDFAILPLAKDLIEQLGNVAFINEVGMLNNAPEAKDGFFLGLGFPNSKNKKANNKEGKVTQNPFVYSSTLNLDENVFKQVGATARQHYLLDFCSKYSKDENNIKVNSISPKGTSGGALFFIKGTNNPNDYRLDAECVGKLAGILIENHEREKVIMATKISEICNALRGGLIRC